MHAAPAAVGHDAGKHVVEHEKGRLAAVADRDVGRRESPVKLPVEEVGHHAAKPFFPLGRLVDAEQAVALFGIRQDGLQAALESKLYPGDAPGVAAAHENHVRVVAQGGTEVVHEFDDAGVAGEFLPEGR